VQRLGRRRLRGGVHSLSGATEDAEHLGGTFARAAEPVRHRGIELRCFTSLPNQTWQSAWERKSEGLVEVIAVCIQSSLAAVNVLPHAAGRSLIALLVGISAPEDCNLCHLFLLGHPRVHPVPKRSTACGA
jgi:hypothetical protein